MLLLLLSLLLIVRMVSACLAHVYFEVLDVVFVTPDDNVEVAVADSVEIIVAAVPLPVRSAS